MSAEGQARTRWKKRKERGTTTLSEPCRIRTISLRLFEPATIPSFASIPPRLPTLPLSLKFASNALQIKVWIFLLFSSRRFWSSLKRGSKSLSCLNEAEFRIFLLLGFSIYTTLKLPWSSIVKYYDPRFVCFFATCTGMLRLVIDLMIITTLMIFQLFWKRLVWSA